MLNDKIKMIFTNFSYTFISNLVSLIISTVLILIVPKLIGISDYGYWQLYIFYTLYIGFFNIGWVEGIYLRYGGKEYHNLNRSLFASQFWSFFVYIIFLGSFIIIYSYIFITESDKQFIFGMVAVCLILSVPRGFLYFILQSTNKIKEFSKLTLIDRIVYALIIVIMLLIGIRDYRELIFADLIGKAITLMMVMYICKEILFNELTSIKENFKEIILNISVGIKLMLANIASLFIIGVVRLGIERTWSVETFGKVSLTLSISNLMMIFINALGIIMFPILRRTDEKKLSSIYLCMRDLLMIVLLGAMIAYYPIKSVLSAWLPNYSESLMYMAMLFPMVIFEGKMSLLINTYLKTMRKEKLMLRINLISLVISVVITIILTVIFNSLNLAVLSILIVLVFRSVLSEVFLSKVLEISIFKDIALELGMTILFIIVAWFVNSWIAFFIYSLFYVIYLFIKRRDIVSTIKNLKLLSKIKENSR